MNVKRLRISVLVEIIDAYRLYRSRLIYRIDPLFYLEYAISLYRRSSISSDYRIIARIVLLSLLGAYSSLI